MNYKEITERIYRVVRHPTQWTNRDMKRIEKMSIYLQEEIEKELANNGLIPMLNDNLIIEDKEKTIENLSINKETDIETDIETDKKENKSVLITGLNKNDQPLSILQRLIMEQDNAPLTDIIKKTQEVFSPTSEKKEINKSEYKRYWVEIYFDRILNKPYFQLFKGNDIVEKDFKTDKIIKRSYLYYAVIDCKSSQEIYKKIPEFFITTNIIIKEVDKDYMPPQYKSCWRNETNLD